LKTYDISVIIVALNEAHDIGDCIKSVYDWVNEVIVYDSGSNDGTPELCESLGAKIYRTDWPGDGPQKNRAIDSSTSKWILCLDADERVSVGLREEIQQAVNAQANHVAYSMPRSSCFCGTFMRHSGWWPDSIVRLFRNGEARFSNLTTHASLQFSGSKGKLRSPIIHYAYKDLFEAISKINDYSEKGAIRAFKNGRRSSFSKAMIKSLWAFVRTYILRLGILDGRMGFVLACSNAHETWYRYLKIWLLNDSRSE
jgi:glycosyltransferase involved in cell wall biosynthesis